MTNSPTILFDPDTYLWLTIAILAILTLTVAWWLRRSRRRLPALLCLAFLLFGWYMVIYGAFIEFTRLEVRHVEYASEDLPDAFDGYRIVQFSDAHLGTYNGWRQPILRRAIDSINAQKADLIVFTGDLQNKEPDEIKPNIPLLKQLKAHDGVCSVMGNHDYPNYVDLDEIHKVANLCETMNTEEDMGWRLLNNTWRRIRRGEESIVIAGMENDGEKRFPQLGDITSALSGLNRKTFVVMLEHDPTSWRRKILPHSHCQLTLSGHTHGGQFNFFGLSPAMFTYRELGGMYYAGNRALNVSTGLGGVVPIRLGTTPEIVVITLKKK